MQHILFTGATGFLGRNMLPILKERYEVTTIGKQDRNDLIADFATGEPELGRRYDVVLHAAGKAHVYPKTEAERQVFYDVNVKGTMNLCRALERVGCPEAFVFVSSMNVYGSKPGNMDTEETRELVGDNTYADSKIKAEAYLTEWCREHGVILTILRPGLIAGPSAPGNLGAMVRGIRTGAYLSIAGGRAKKSIVMAEDIANVVLLAVDKGGIYNVCDDYNPSFGELERCIARQLGKRPPINVPYWFAKCLALVGDVLPFFPINSARLEKIVTPDTWSNERAKRVLGWKPMDVLANYKI